MELAARPNSSLDHLGYRGFADLYRTLSKIGISPPVADQMEIWKIAALLGGDIEKPEDDWQPTEADLARMAALPTGGDITTAALSALGVRPRNPG